MIRCYLILLLLFMLKDPCRCYSFYKRMIWSSKVKAFAPCTSSSLCGFNPCFSLLPGLLLGKEFRKHCTSGGVLPRVRWKVLAVWGPAVWSGLLWGVASMASLLHPFVMPCFYYSVNASSWFSKRRKQQLLEKRSDAKFRLRLLWDSLPAWCNTAF